MSAGDWALALLLSFLIGMMGQLCRTIVGLKKVWNEAADAKTAFRSALYWPQLVVSLAIGGVAGCLGSLMTTVDVHSLTKEVVIILLGSGYAGTDAIEGFFLQKTWDTKKKGQTVPGPI